jgi:CRP/FNR family transcriptional activator FtrB
VTLNARDVDRIRSLPLFNKVSDPCLPTLVKSASLRRFRARSLLFSEGDQASALYTLIRGSVELFSECHDRRLTIAIIRCANPFILTSLADDLNSISAQTLEASEVLAIPLNIIHALIDTDPAFAHAIVLELARDLRGTIEQFKNYRLRKSTERLAEWLLRSEREAGGTGHFVMPCAKGVLASHLGMTPESLSRNLASLAPLGVSVQRRHIMLIDRTALAQFARLDAISPVKQSALSGRSALHANEVLESA